MGLSLKGLTRMSPILPISFLVTLLCAFGAVEGVPFQQALFVGAALSATILVCSLEAWEREKSRSAATTSSGFAITRTTSRPGLLAMTISIKARPALGRAVPGR